MNSFLMDQAVRATLLLIAAYLSAFAMRRASASARRLVWIVAAACLLPILREQPLPLFNNGAISPCD
jgi:hypothetical protein